jgi:hypothetical protein
MHWPAINRALYELTDLLPGFGLNAMLMKVAAIN